MIRLVVLSALLLGLFVLVIAPAVAAPVYSSITEISSRELSNGVQITIKADGVIEWHVPRRFNSTTPTSRLEVHFPASLNSSGESTFYINKYPVSLAQLQIAPDAREGVGVELYLTMIEPSTFSVSQSDDLTSVVVTINSDRTLAAGAGGKGAGGEAESQLFVEVDDMGLLTINAQKANFSKLVRLVGEKTGLDVVVNDAASLANLTLSINITGADAGAALEAIASATGLALSKQGDEIPIYMFSQGIPVDLASYRLSATESFSMDQILASDAPKMLPNFLLQYLHVNNAQNAVVVTAPDQMLEKIGSDLGKVDIGPPVIMVEALVVEFKDTKDKDVFMDMVYRSGERQWVTQPDQGLSYYTDIGQLPRDFEASLKALENDNTARVMANPRMSCLNGRYATVFIGKVRVINVEFLSYGTLVKLIQGVNVGVSLTIAPWTGGNGEITTLIVPQVSNIAELDRESGLPTLSTRQVSTTVRVKDGQTIIIGGLKQTQEFERESKLPILGDLPLIGDLFTRKTTSSVDSELVIFLTPHILNPDTCQLENDPREQRWREEFLGADAANCEVPLPADPAIN